MEAIQKYLKDEVEKMINKPIQISESLFQSRTIDSVQLLDLIIAIEEQYSVTVNPQEVTAEEFDTIELMSKYINSKLQS